MIKENEIHVILIDTIIIEFEMYTKKCYFKYIFKIINSMNKNISYSLKKTNRLHKNYSFRSSDPLQPGAIIRRQNNFSPDDLYLKWEKSSTSFVNRYKVTIDNKTQYTLGYEPEIRWNSLLMPLEEYEVTIIAVSYGYTTNYPNYGTKESAPSVSSITTTPCKLIFISSISYDHVKEKTLTIQLAHCTVLQKGI